MTDKFFSQENPILVEATRSGRREALHIVHAVLADSSGTVLGKFGDPDVETYERSLAKPLQLLTVLKIRPSLLDECSHEEIALMASSHSGESDHVKLVLKLLERYGLDENSMTCGYHYPFIQEAVWEIGKADVNLSPAFHNCSGKHVSMLLACETMGWPDIGYEDPSHPMQVANNITMARYTNTLVDDLQYGVDGCGVVSWWMSLKSIASACARFGDPDFAEDEFEKTVKDKIFDAYHRAAWYTAGTGRFGTPFNRESDGCWLGKIGGEAVFGVCLKNRGLGITIKVLDGNSRALGPSLLYAMDKWGLVSDDQLSRLNDWRRVIRKNAPGTHIGYDQVVEE